MRWSDARRSFDDAGLAAKVAGQLDEALGAELVGAPGKADQDLAGQDQDVAAVGEAFVELEHARETAPQRRGDLGGLAHPRRRPGLQEDRPLGKDEGRVLDEHCIGIVGERIERLDRQSRRLERGGIGLKLRQHAFIGRGRVAGAQALDHARRRVRTIAALKSKALIRSGSAR